MARKTKRIRGEADATAGDPSATAALEGDPVRAAELFRALIENSLDAIAIVNQDGTIRYHSPSFGRMLGHDSKERIGRNSFDLAHPDDVARAAEQFQWLLQNRDCILRTEVRARHKDGSWHTLEIVGNNLVADPAVNGIVANFRDITERKVAQEQVREYVRELEFLSRTAMELVELSGHEDIYGFMGQRLGELVTDAVVVVSAFDEKSCAFSVRAILGLGEREDAIAAVLGRGIVGMQFPISEQARAGLSTGRLEKVPGGICELTCGGLSNAASSAIEETLGLGDVHAIGVAWKGALFGSATFLMPAGSVLKNATVIEAFVGQASVALQRWLAENALRDIQERYHNSFENAPISLWEEDLSEVRSYVDRLRDGGVENFEEYFEQHPGEVVKCAGMVKVIDVNNATMRLHGAERKDDLLAGLSKTFTKGSYDAFAKTLVAIAEGKTVYETETSVRKLDGEKVHVVMKWSAAPGYEDSLGRLSVSFTDIAAIKLAEEALRQSEEHYAALIGNLTDAVFHFKGGVISWCNDRVEEIYGYPEEELLGKSASFFYPSEVSSPEFTADVSASIVKRGLYRGTSKFRRKDGSVVDLEYSLSQIPGRGQTEVIAVARDVTERRRIEEALKESEQNFRALAENSLDAITVLADGGRHVYANQRVAEISGYTMEELRNTTFGDLVHPAGLQKLAERHARKAAGEPRLGHYEAVIVRKNGTAVPIEVTAARTLWQGERAVVVMYRDISVRKRAEEQLRIKENAIENSITAMAMSDMDGTVTYVNGACMRLWGSEDKGELVGRRYWELMESDEIIEDVAKGMKERQAWAGQVVGRRKEGAEIHVDVLSAIVKDDQGKPIQTISSFVDVTERKKMEEEMRVKDSAIASAVNGIALADLEGRLKYVNPSFLKMWGHADAGEVVGRSALEFWQGEDDAGGVMAAVIERGSWQGELVAVRKDGSTFDAQLSASVVKGEGGAPVCIMGSFVDITERKKMEEALRQSEDNYRVLFDSTSDGLIVVDAETLKIVFGNRRAAQLYGFEHQLDGIGMSLFDFVHPDDRELVIRGFAEDLHTRERRKRYEVRVVGRDGTEMWASALATRIEFQGRLAVLLSVRDITERKRAEGERKRLEEQLHMAGRLAAVGELSAGVAHELNNPLAAVQAFAQFLTQRENLDENTRRDVEVIYKEAQRATRITGNLLSFARRNKPEKKLISINEVVERSLELQVYQMNVNNVQVVTELAPDLPKTMADFQQMQQVFVNIISNAEQAMTEAHGRGKLIVASERAESMIRIRFTDDGPGIAEENLKRIFDPFFTTKEVGKGTGLGLSICYGFVEGHGGHMYARSRPGEGATFVVEIPVFSGSEYVDGEVGAVHTQ